MRAVAYLLVGSLGIGVIIASIVSIWEVAIGGKAADWKAIGSLLLFAVWWTWALVKIYSNYIKRPGEEKTQSAHEADQILRRILEPESPLSSAVHEVKDKFPIVGEPRYRDSENPTFDTVVQLETSAFTILLFGKDGVVTFWEVR